MMQNIDVFGHRRKLNKDDHTFILKIERSLPN